MVKGGRIRAQQGAAKRTKVRVPASGNTSLGADQKLYESFALMRNSGNDILFQLSYCDCFVVAISYKRERKKNMSDDGRFL